MKYLLSTMMAACCLCSAYSAVADVNDDLKNVCTIVKNNDKSEFRKKMRTIQQNYNMRLGDFYSGVSCSGASLIRFAMQNHADDVGVYMIKNMSKGDLQKPEGDGKTIQQWSVENKLADGLIGKELVARIH